MSLYHRLREIYLRDNATSSAAYEANQKRDEIVASLTKGITSIRKTHRLGLEAFTDEYLGAIGNKYLVADFRGPNGNITYRNRLAFQVVEICPPTDDDHPFVRDVATGDILGRITKWSFRGWIPFHEEMDLTCKSKKTWVMSHTYPIVLPLNGPVAHHPYGRNLINIAEPLLTDNEQVSAIRDLDKKLDQLCDEMRLCNTEAIEMASAYFADNTGDRHAELVAAYPALVRDIETMDFTYDEADRPSRTMREQEFRIQDALAMLSLDDAIALFVLHERIYWKYAFSYLNRHPEILAQARAAAA